MNREGNAALHPTLYVRSCLHRQDGSRPKPIGRYAQRPTTKISGSVAFKALLCTISNISSGPHVGPPLCVRAPLRHIKGRACTIGDALETLSRLSQRHAKTLTTQARFHSEQPCSQPLESASNTTHSGRRVLRSGGPNHSKPVVFIVFLHLDWTNPSYPRVITL